MPTAAFNYAHITFLTFQAVLEVVIVCLAGFWAARSGLLDNQATKTISRLNVDLFTPALIFSKLASSLSLRKLLEVIVIPVLYAVTTLVSYVSATWISGWLRLAEPETNFVTAMAVFGNSNSLPVSLTLALAYTLPGLEWDDVEGDNADKIASRGLVYLLIFQQLGQMLRWSWGFNTLLKRQPASVIYGTNENVEEALENGENEMSGEITEESQPLLHASHPNFGSTESLNKASDMAIHSQGSSSFPVSDISSVETHTAFEGNAEGTEGNTVGVMPTRTVSRNERGELVVEIEDNKGDEDENEEIETVPQTPPQKILSKFKSLSARFVHWMNPPLWSMLLAIIVASIGPIRYEFYEADGFVQNTLAKAIRELGSVSIPLILVVLGANLAPSAEIPPPTRHYSRMIFGSLISRMVLPSLVLLPLIVACVKYLHISIMDDPIFLVTSFLLISSPPAIQLSQICQLNEIYQKEMAGVLFYGYVILTLPVTIFIVVTALQCLVWARS